MLIRIVLRSAPLRLQVFVCLLLIENLILVAKDLAVLGIPELIVVLICIQWRCTSWTLGPTCSCDLVQYEHKRYNQMYTCDSGYLFVGSCLLRNLTVQIHRGSSVIRCIAVLSASAQSCLGKLACIYMLRAHSKIVMFMRFATLFWWGSQNRLRSLISPTWAKLLESDITVFALVVRL